MTRAKDISKIVTDADLSGTLDVTGTVTAGDVTMTRETGGYLFNTGGSTRAGIRSDDQNNLTLRAGTDAIKMHVGADGNVGIGISNPDDKLHVADSSNAELKLQTDNANGGSVVKFNRSGTDNSYIGTKGYFLGNSDNNLYLRANSGLGIQFYTNGNNERMRIDSSGNVGIGETSPQGNLHIKGSDSGVTSSPSHADELIIENSTNGGMTFNCGASNSATITFQNSTYSDDGALQYRNGDRAMAFKTAGSERMRVDSSGNLLVGQTSFAYGSVGCSMTSSGQLGGTANGDSSLILNRKTSDGTIAQFRKDNTVVGTIGTSSGFLYAGHDDVGLIFRSNESIRPYNPSTLSERDNQIDLGVGAVRFDDIFATNGTIQTSDRNEKQDIEELSDAEQRVAVVSKVLMRKFRWIDSVAEKGDNARTHFGIIAQDLQDAFTAEGLDAGDYAMFTSDTWWEKEISVDAVEADEENGIEAKDAYTYMDIKEEATEGYTEKTRLGVRYNQLLAFIISAL
jgi:hypothetical protein